MDLRIKFFIMFVPLVCTTTSFSAVLPEPPLAITDEGGRVMHVTEAQINAARRFLGLLRRGNSDMRQVVDLLGRARRQRSPLVAQSVHGTAFVNHPPRGA